MIDTEISNLKYEMYYEQFMKDKIKKEIVTFLVEKLVPTYKKYLGDSEY